MKLNTSKWLEVAREAPDNPGGAPAEQIPNEPAVEGAGDTAANPPAADSAPDFSWVPDSYKVDQGGYDFAKFRADHDAAVAAQAQLTERLAGVPDDASGYAFTLPDDLDFSDIEGLPEGFTVKALTDSDVFKPLYDQLGAVMHKHGAPAEMAGDVMRLLARYKATEVAQTMEASRAMEAQAMEASRAEIAKIPDFEARIATLHRVIDARLPKDEAEALRGVTQTAAAMRALERLVSPAKVGQAPAVPGGVQKIDPLTARYSRSGN